MIHWYFDSSVVLHVILPWGDLRADNWTASAIKPGNAFFASTLLQLEVVRVLRREKLELSLSHALFNQINFLSIDNNVLQVAANIEPHIKSLDAIHLATCILMEKAPTIVSHDNNLKKVATQLGFKVFDPLAD